MPDGWAVRDTPRACGHFGLKSADIHCVRSPTGFGVRGEMRRGPRGSCWDSRVRSSTPRADGGPGSEAHVWERGQLISDKAMQLPLERSFRSSHSCS